MSSLKGKSQAGIPGPGGGGSERSEANGGLWYDSLKPVELDMRYLRLRAGFRFDKRPHITFVHPARWVRTPDG